MEKEPQPDSITTVTIKPDYAPSITPSDGYSEPPPAYRKSQSSAVQVARIVAVTVVLVSFVLGGFLLASAYVTANASCRQLEQELELLSEAADRFQPLQPEALIQDEPSSHKRQTDDNQEAASSAAKKEVKEVNDNSVDSDSSNSDSSDSSDSSSDSSSESEEEERPIHFKLPLQLDFDDLAGALIERNQKSRMNCVVEKKRAEEVVDHQPKMLRLPFGVNLTTDPRYEHVTGERMAIFCESGNFQRHMPQQQDDEDDSDEDEDTIMIQPVMVPIPQSHFPTHMAQQMPPQQQYRQIQMHPMEAMRPPMPPQMQQQQQIQQQLQQQQQQQQQQQSAPFPPTSVLHHIAQQIIAQKIMEAQKIREEQQSQESTQQEEQEIPIGRVHFPHLPEGMIAQRIPIPEEVLTQLNRLPNRDVIVAVSEQEPEEMPHDSHSQQQQSVEQPQMRVVQQEMRVVPQEIRVVQQPRQNAQEMNGRQTYARGLPVDIPVHMIQQEQEPQAAPSEEARPHYVQPRSVRSVDALVPQTQKRVKRCSCDCAC